jgi:hypothetical protein
MDLGNFDTNSIAAGLHFTAQEEFAPYFNQLNEAARGREADAHLDNGVSGPRL